MKYYFTLTCEAYCYDVAFVKPIHSYFVWSPQVQNAFKLLRAGDQAKSTSATTKDPTVVAKRTRVKQVTVFELQTFTLMHINILGWKKNITSSLGL